MPNRRRLFFISFVVIATGLFWLAPKASAQSLSASPTPTVVVGTPATIAFNNPSPTDLDWIGLFYPGDGNWLYQDYVYTSNCSQLPGGSARASGSCDMIIPAAQTYEFRLFPDDLFDPLLATSNQVTGTPAPPSVPTVDIKANGSDGPITIAYNTAATISWTSTNATSCTISPPGWTGTFDSQNTGALTASVTYTADCSGPGGNASPDSVTVNVLAPPSLSASPSPTVVVGTPATITFNNPFPTDLDWIGLFYPGDSNWLYQDYVYTSNCSQLPGGPARSSGSCDMIIPAAQIYEFRLFPDDVFDPLLATSNQVTGISTTVDLKANGSNGPITIAYNTAATISWTSTNATACTISPPGWTGTFDSQNTGALTASVTYTADCSGPGGSGSDPVTVNVGAAPTLSASPSSTMAGSPVSVTFSNQFPTTTDWIGLYTLGSANSAYTSRVYTSSCTSVPGGTARSAGVCGMTIPAATTYEFRFFANDGYGLLATSNQVTGSFSAPASPAFIEETIANTSDASFSITLDYPLYQAYRATFDGGGTIGFFCGIVTCLGGGSASICMYESFTANQSCVSGFYFGSNDECGGAGSCIVPYFFYLEYPALASFDYDPAHNFDGALFTHGGVSNATSSATVFGRRVFMNSFDAYIP